MYQCPSSGASCSGTAVPGVHGCGSTGSRSIASVPIPAAAVAGATGVVAFISSTAVVALSRSVKQPVTEPGQPPVCPTQVRPSCRSSCRPSPQARVHPRGSAITCGWHISSRVSGERISASGSARKPPHRERSVAVERSPPAGSRPLASTSGSGSGTSVKGGT